MENLDTFRTLVSNVQYHNSISKDLLVPTSKVDFSSDMNMAIDFGPAAGEMRLAPNTVAHEHVSQFLGIPLAFYREQKKSNPDLLASLASGLMHRKNGDNKRMLRLYEPPGETATLRAMVSPNYRRLDNYDLLTAIAPFLASRDDVHIVNGAVTERRMYLTAVFNKMEGAVRVGDVVRAGFRISNSETRCGSVRVEPFLYRLVCLNGMTATTTLNIRHAGAGLVEDADTMEVLTDETRAARDKATWMEVHDLVKACTNQQVFDSWIHQAQRSMGHEIKKDVVDVIENVSKAYKLTTAESSNVLENMLRSNDPNAWGIANAITAVGRETEDFDRRAELEKVGGEIITLNSKDWMRLAA